jgi:cellobiose-specific phosphotransferase system component IIC
MNRKKGFSLWPALGDEQAAVLAARQGFHAAVYCSIVTAIFAVLGGFGFKIMDFNLWNLTDAGLMALLAFGIRRMSRTAAVIALLYYVARRIDLWAEYGFQNPVIAAIFVLMFLSAVRGTFAYYRLKPRPKGLNPVPAADSSADISLEAII